MIKLGRRKSRFGKTPLLIGGGVIGAIVIMFVAFPFVTDFLTVGLDSNEVKLAFPNIDNSQLFGGALTGLSLSDFTSVSTNLYECFFKYTILTKNSAGQTILTDESNFNSNKQIFTVPQDISAPTGQLIDRYEITPKIRCDKKIFATEEQKRFETALIVLPSKLSLQTSFIQPDGKVIKLPIQTLTVQSTGAQGTIIITGEDLFGFIPNINPFDDFAGVLIDNREILFKGFGGAFSPDQFWTIKASDIDNKLQALPDRYTTDLTFQVFTSADTGLNINNLFSESSATYPLTASSLSTTVQITVDRRADVPPSQTDQSITIVSAITSAGQTIVGNNEVPINPDGSQSQRTVEVKAFLREFQSLVETTPILQMTHQSGSRVSGTSPVTMQNRGSDIFSASIIIPTSVADGTYLFKVTNSRSNVGSATFTVNTPPPDAPQPIVCDGTEVSDGMGGCKEPATTLDCRAGFAPNSSGTVCVEQFCSDGTSATLGCTIIIDVGSQCVGAEVEQPDGTCVPPTCTVGTEWDRSTAKCTTIVCADGEEFDSILLSCQTVKTGVEACEIGEKREGGQCVPIGGDNGGSNILNIRQELIYAVLTSDQSGKRVPVESGTIPSDESLFTGLTALQFLTGTAENPQAKFEQITVDARLVLPQTLSSPEITNVQTENRLFYYHKNVILPNGLLTDNTKSALLVTHPSDIFTKVERDTGGGSFPLTTLALDTSDILTTVTGVSGASNCFEVGDVCTTVGGVELKEGDTISLRYTIEGTYDLSTNAGANKFEGVIKQMTYWKNLIYTDKVLVGDECTAKSGADLYQCIFDTTGNNLLEGVCPPDPDKTEKENFDECLASLDDRAIELIQTNACEDSDNLTEIINILNSGSGFTEEFGGTGVKTTEEIVADLRSASGCECKIDEKPENGQCVKKDASEIEIFECPAGTQPLEGVTPTKIADCEAKDACSEEETGIVGGGEAHVKDDGTTECRAPAKTNTSGELTCETGSAIDPVSGQCVWQPATESTSTLAGVNALFESLAKLLQGFTNSDNPTVTGGGSSGGSSNGGGACAENVLNCLVELFKTDDESTDIIPPSLQIAGSSNNTIILFVVIIVALLVTARILSRRRKKLLG